MNLNHLTWNELEPFLRKARSQSSGSCLRHKSIFKILSNWFADKELNIRNFSIYLSELEDAGISPAHQNNHIKLVKHLSYFLGEQSIFADFPFLQVPDSSPQYILTVEEIEKLAEINMGYKRYKERRWKHRALIYFMGNVGSRLSETLLLEWRDIIEAPSPMIHIRAETTKTKHERICPIPEWLHKMLLKLPHENEKIFNRIEQTNFREDLANRAIKVKIPYKVIPGTFRDTSVNNKLSCGVPLQEVSRYHGHRKIDTTLRYYTLIEATQLANTLQKYDPAYQKDLTYRLATQVIKQELESKLVSRLYNYVYKSTTNEDGKKEVWFGYVEK